MRPRSLVFLALVLSLATIALAQPVRIAPGLELTQPQRLSGFRFGGSSDGDVVHAVIPRGDGFLAFYRHADEIRTVRIDAEGRPDLPGTRTVATTPSQSQFFIRTNATRAVFFWIEGGIARFSPVDADGTPLSRAGIAIAPALQYTAAICNPTRCLARYYDTGRPTRERAAIVGIDGTVFASDLQLPQIFWRRDAGTDDHGFLLTALTSEAPGRYRTHLIRIDDDGRQTFDTILEEADAEAIALAPPGSSRYALVWQDGYSNNPDRGTHAAFLTLDGTLSDERKLMTGANLSPAALAWNGSEFVYAWHLRGFRYVIPESVQPADLFVQRLDRNLALIGTPSQISLSQEGNYLASLAVNGPKAYAVYNEYRDGGFVAIPRGALLDARGQVVARDAFVIGPISQLPLAVAATNDRTVAFWRERNPDTSGTRLLYARAARGGPALDPEPFVLSESYTIGSAAASALESDVLVVWQQNATVDYEAQTLRAAIVHTADGRSEAVALPQSLNGALSFDVANDGTNWLIAAGTRAARVSRAGLVLDPLPVTFSAGTFGSVSIASDGTRFLIARVVQESSACAGCGGVRSVLLGPDGRVARADRQISDRVEGQPSLAFNGRDYLLISNAGDQLNLRRLSGAGDVLSATTIVRPPESVEAWKVVRLGSGWLATWLARATGTVYGVRVNAEGQVVDTPFVLAGFPRLTSRPDGAVVALASIPVDVPPYGRAGAVTLQELTSQSQPRRRAAGFR